MNVKGSCPVQLLVDVQKLRTKIELVPDMPPFQPKPPKPVIEPEMPYDINDSGDGSTMTRRLFIDSARQAISTSGHVVGKPDGDLNEKVRHFSPTLLGFVAASPIGKVIEKCCQGCFGSAGLGGGGAGTGGGTGGSAF